MRVETSADSDSNALEWLEKAFEQHSPMMAWLKVDRRFDPLRKDRRFQDLLTRVGLAN
jgi:hypothetical protein